MEARNERKPAKVRAADLSHNLLKKMTGDNDLELHGTGRGAYYTLKRTDKHT